MSATKRTRSGQKPVAPVQPSRPLRRAHGDFAWAALLAGAVFAAYWPALLGSLIVDDAAHITPRALRSWQGLWRIWTEPGASLQYYPVLHTAFWIEHKLWGDSVLGYHLVNVFQHIVAALLVVLIVKRLELPGHWLAGFLFALHPVCVEAVAWISEQKSTLSAVFYLSSALAYLRFDRSRSRLAYAGSFVFFLAALGSKTVTASLPAALLLVLWWQRGRLSLRREVAPLAPWFLLSAGAGVFTAWMEREFIGAQGPEFAFRFLDRCLIAGRAVWFYLTKLLWPAGLTFVYPRWHVDSSAWWQYLYPLAVAVTVAVFWLARGKSRGPLTAFLFFVGTLFPALGFINVYPFLYSFVADHYQYLATIGIFAAAAAGLTSLRLYLAPSGRPFWSAALTALVVLLGVLSRTQAGIYRDAETLYRYVLSRNPSCWMAHNNLGRVLLDSPGRVEEAELHLRQAIRLNPGSSMSHYNLGALYEKLPDRLDDAVLEYEQAASISPGFAEAHDALGKVLLLKGRSSEAIQRFSAALRLKPEDPRTHNNLGVALARVGRPAEALPHFDAALRLDPEFVEAHANRGLALATLGRLPEAATALETALRLQPDSLRYQRLLERVRQASAGDRAR